MTTELAILIGLQASGKTTFYRQRLAGTHVHVSKDNFGKRSRGKQARQLRLIAEALEADRNVAVDNTNPSPEDWAPLIEIGRAHGARVVAYWFPLDVEGTMARNALRPPDIRVPDVGIYATLGRMRRPGPSSGFDRVWAVRFDGAGGFEVTDATEGS
ncbi:ATP-binding protein [Actinomadura rudentiformis]|uniref:ATP-binding protein n=1 Tax=Actinomadura rudentiformis TaxID=359158 RepID=A0A6H9YGF7_9ACTN|nr:ATP-binding protein [Actinomadura rudentiformis]KAB2339340.1 ATP-binding protein [Actinomadura rudentiformis]